MFLAVGCQQPVTASAEPESPAIKAAVDEQQEIDLPEKTAQASEKPPSSKISNPSVQPHPRTADLNDAQLSKSHTLFVLAFDSTTRHKYFFANFPSTNSPPQADQVRDLVDSYDKDFKKLRDQRAAILETARDGHDVDVLLRNNRIETVLLSRQVRGRIFREILTKKQQEQQLADAKARAAAMKQRNQSKK